MQSISEINQKEFVLLVNKNRSLFGGKVRRKEERKKN